MLVLEHSLIAMSSSSHQGYVTDSWQWGHSPGFSTGRLGRLDRAAPWLGTVSDWEHLTRSAQLGPVLGRRTVASVGGGPLGRTNGTQSEVES